MNFLVTGGAGFIGSNYVSRLLNRGETVTVYDNLQRRGGPHNIDWLRKTYGRDSFRLAVKDVREASALEQAASGVDVIVHLASQVAVTTSVQAPREDFEINALGTLNMLEAARSAGSPPIVIYASTNKVYGGMEDVRVEETALAYRYVDYPQGIPEGYPLDFHSPYGCSKGAGDQYVRDYHRIYGVPSVVMRQSSIYGPRQYGVEDQGWVAWFVIASLTGQPITVYGDGKQVRDLLYVEDLLDVYDAAIQNIDRAAGQVYNIGGGPQHTLSIWHQFHPILEEALGENIEASWADWRPGDQRIYVADIRKAAADLGWAPRVGVETGIQRLIEWARQNVHLFT